MSYSFECPDRIILQDRLQNGLLILEFWHAVQWSPMKIPLCWLFMQNFVPKNPFFITRRDTVAVTSHSPIIGIISYHTVTLILIQNVFTKRCNYTTLMVYTYLAFSEADWFMWVFFFKKLPFIIKWQTWRSKESNILRIKIIDRRNKYIAIFVKLLYPSKIFWRNHLFYEYHWV